MFTAASNLKAVAGLSSSNFCSINTTWDRGDGTPFSGGDLQATNINGTWYVNGSTLRTAPDTKIGYLGGSQGSDQLESPVFENLGIAKMAAGQSYSIFIRTFKGPTPTSCDPTIAVPFTGQTAPGQYYIDSAVLSFTLPADYICNGATPTETPTTGKTPKKKVAHSKIQILAKVKAKNHGNS